MFPPAFVPAPGVCVQGLHSHRVMPAQAMARTKFFMCAPRTAVETGADLTKWVVSCAVGGGLLYFHDASSILLAFGGLANAAVTKVAKRVINAPRPESAPESKRVTAGMPSSHASSLAYFAMSLVLLIRQPYTLATLVLACIASGWRVTAKYHTTAQMIAGLMLGSANACLVVLGIMPWATNILSAVLSTQSALHLTFGLICVGIGFVFGPSIVELAKQRK